MHSYVSDPGQLAVELDPASGFSGFANDRLFFLPFFFQITGPDEFAQSMQQYKKTVQRYFYDFSNEIRDSFC